MHIKAGIYQENQSEQEIDGNRDNKQKLAFNPAMGRQTKRERLDSYFDLHGTGEEAGNIAQYKHYYKYAFAGDRTIMFNNPTNQARHNHTDYSIEKPKSAALIKMF